VLVDQVDDLSDRRYDDGRDVDDGVDIHLYSCSFGAWVGPRLLVHLLVHLDRDLHGLDDQYCDFDRCWVQHDVTPQ
jgi:hypothetical protein